MSACVLGLGSLQFRDRARLPSFDSRRRSARNRTPGRASFESKPTKRGICGRASATLAGLLLALPLFVKALEFDTNALLERIANVLGDCLAVGTLNRKTGALSASLPRAELWADALTRAAAGKGAIFPGVRLAAVAAVLNNAFEGKARAAELEYVSLAAENARIVFQRCPWDDGDVLFVILPDDGGAESNFALLRLVLESVRRDVAIVRAPRVEERCWN